MIATVRFYRMKGGLSSGEYPLFNVSQDLTSKLVHTVSRKVTKDIHQTIEVPEFTDYESCNICEIDGLYYWITSFSQSTITAGSINFVLDLMAPTSFLRSNVNVRGSWHKLPRNVCPYLHEEVSNGFMDEISSSRPTNIECGAALRWVAESSFLDNRDAYWIQIIGYDSSNNIKKWGGFIPYEPNRRRLSYGNIEVKANSGSTFYYYPSFYELYKNINRYTGLDASKILDFSVSARCPYEIDKTEITSLLETRYGFRLINATNDQTIDPTEVYQSGTTHYYLYDITNYPFKEKSQTVTVTPSDEQRAIGSVVIKDWNGNAVMTLPNRSSHSVFFQTVGDLNGIYTLIKAGKQIISVPEGKLPFLSNSWEYYQAYSMDTDRTIMENTLKYAKYEQETAQISGIANTAINAVGTGIMAGFVSGSGPIGAAVGVGSTIAGAGVSYWEGIRGYDLKEMQARDDYYLTQKKAKLEPQTAYNVGYGAVYCDLNGESPLRVAVLMPNGIDDNYIASWFKQYGHAVEGVRTAQIEPGYYQGSIINDGSLSGVFFDELNRDFMRGFRFIKAIPDYQFTYSTKRVASDGTEFYTRLQLGTTDAEFEDTVHSLYDTLMLQGEDKYLVDNSGLKYGIDPINGFKIGTTPTSILIQADKQIVTNTRVLSSQTPVNLNTILLTDNYELKQR